MKLMKTVDAVGHVLCHDMTQIIPGEYKDARFRKGHVVTPEDIPVFQSFDRTAQNLTGKSLRLNVFDEVGTVICRPEWQVKDHMRGIPNCPLPEGEVLMRYQPSKNP